MGSIIFHFFLIGAYFYFIHFLSFWLFNIFSDYYLLDDFLPTFIENFNFDMADENLLLFLLVFLFY